MYSKTCQTSKKERFAKIVNDFQPFRCFGRVVNTPLINAVFLFTTFSRFFVGGGKNIYN